VLYLYDNQITELKNLPATLTQLHIQNNNITRMENLSHLKHLTKLFLDRNAIAKLEGLENCCKMEELSIANQRLPRGGELQLDYPSLEGIAVSLACPVSII